MDDALQKVQQQSSLDPSQHNQQPAASTVNGQPQPVSQPVNASPIKEAEPIPVQETAAVEYVKPSEPEPSLSKEVMQAGVQTVTPPLPTDEKIGIRASAESVPVTHPNMVIDRLMNQQEIQTNMKKAPSESPRWLAELLKVVWTKLRKKDLRPAS